MDTKESQSQIDELKVLVKALRRDVDLIAGVLSRYGITDPKILQHNFEILDRLNKLDGK